MIYFTKVLLINIYFHTAKKAYGRVHPARLVETGEKVALKKISKQYTDSASFTCETDARKFGPLYRFVCFVSLRN